jgi:hypothetical protein
MHDGAPRCRPRLESWQSRHAGSRLQGEDPVYDGARMADGAVTRLAAAASSSVCRLSASRPQVAGHRDWCDGMRRLQRQRLLWAAIAAAAMIAAAATHRDCCGGGVRCWRDSRCFLRPTASCILPVG